MFLNVFWPSATKISIFSMFLKVFWLSEAKRIQLMFLKKSASLKLQKVPTEMVEALDRSVTESRVGPHTFDKAILLCQSLLRASLWKEIGMLVGQIKDLFAEMKSRSSSVQSSLSLAMPKRLLDLIGCRRDGPVSSAGEAIIAGEIEIASLAVDDQDEYDLKAKLRKILQSDRYYDLNALAKVVGEDSELLVPGRKFSTR